jgi:hypothetical protein
VEHLGGYHWRKSSYSTNGAECVEVGQAPWRKSSYCGNGGTDCVEVGAPADADRVLVRDTKDRGGFVLRFSPAAGRRFAARLQSEGVGG